MFKYFIHKMFGDREKYLEKNPYFMKDDCPFCIMLEEEKNIVLLETKYWQIRYNKFPYYGHKQNLLAFPKSHKIFTTQLSDEELLDYKNVEQYMKEYFNGKNYFSFIRQGIGGRSIEHIHYHYLEGIIYHEPKIDLQTFKIKNVSKGKI